MSVREILISLAANFAVAGPFGISKDRMLALFA
jgi:hypothetical protein